MKYLNGAQWCALWTATIAAIYVWANLPREFQTEWPRFILWMTPHDREGLAVGIFALGTLLTWQLSRVDLSRAVQSTRLIRIVDRACLVAAAAWAFRLLVWLPWFESDRPCIYDGPANLSFDVAVFMSNLRIPLTFAERIGCIYTDYDTLVRVLLHTLAIAGLALSVRWIVGAFTRRAAPPLAPTRAPARDSQPADLS